MREQAQLHEDYIAQLSVDDSATSFFGKVEDRLTDETVDVTDANAVQHAVEHQARYLERFAIRVQQLRVHISHTDVWKEQRKKRSDLWGNAKRKKSAVMPLLSESFGLSARKGKGESKGEDEREAKATEHEGQGETDASEPTDNRRAKRAWTDKSGRQGIFEEKTTSKNVPAGSHTKVRRLHSAPQSAAAAEAEDNNGTVRRSETREQDAYEAAPPAAIAAEEQLDPNDRTSQAMLGRVKRASAKMDAKKKVRGRRTAGNASDESSAGEGDGKGERGASRPRRSRSRRRRNAHADSDSEGERGDRRRSLSWSRSGPKSLGKDGRNDKPKRGGSRRRRSRSRPGRKAQAGSDIDGGGGERQAKAGKLSQWFRSLPSCFDAFLEPMIKVGCTDMETLRGADSKMVLPPFLLCPSPSARL